MSIEEIFQKLSPIIGTKLKNPGDDQDRNRGAELHKVICRGLGYSSYFDTGQFPDILHQLLEVKLQTSPTIDLGSALPTSTEALETLLPSKLSIKYCDIRYALFYGHIQNNEVTVTNLSLLTGEKFFNYFPQVKGNIVNKKIQIRPPKNFFT